MYIAITTIGIVVKSALYSVKKILKYKLKMGYLLYALLHQCNMNTLMIMTMITIALVKILVL